ncbi:neuronal acetylcholine receptor subunit alpha-3 isoform X2 [Nematostella vectensis]|uniref:neuronal acetylcholine receptor subunit alpha-3 isoform X2 n=1 Tax=Nematostella vectensis TaxID=45351 RepID=UPI0020778166|nr:neuronal acetylcholine receptor subunit alpha-3 isoform X2 [Nematostella vectensis]
MKSRLFVKIIKIRGRDPISVYPTSPCHMSRCNLCFTTFSQWAHKGQQTTETSYVDHTEDVEHRLLNDLFKDYNKEARPVLNKSEAIEVQFDMAYAQLINLRWVNPFLTWDPKMYGGLTSINVNPNMIWKPDIVLYHNIGFGETGAIYKFDTRATIMHNGYTEWFAPTEIHSICAIDITYFPFDEQFCKMKFGSWSYSGRQLNLTSKGDSADLSKYTKSGEWDLLGMRAVRNVVKYSCCPDPFIDITFTMHIRRKVLFYLTNLIAPCIVLATLTVFSFQLPLESGERIGLVITIWLGLTVFMLVFTENVPRTSEVIPLIGKYSFLVMCVVSCSLIVTCCILKVFNKDPNIKMSSWFKKLIFKVLGPLLMMKPPKNDESSATRGDKIRSLLSRGKLKGTHLELKDQVPYKTDQRMRVDNGHVYQSVKKSESATVVSNSQEQLDELLHYVRAMAEHWAERETNEHVSGEWRYAATVLDAVFFRVTFVLILGSTLAFYFMIPSEVRSF